jgi:hypothetical protein
MALSAFYFYPNTIINVINQKQAQTDVERPTPIIKETLDNLFDFVTGWFSSKK